MASSTASKAHLSYTARIPYHNNAAAVKLLELMDRKKTNLCVSVDVTKAKDMLEVTHIDIIEDFTLELAEQLVQLSKELDFMIFEDRKFADIGNTVSLQYSSGVHKIASWSDITNAHPIPGDGIVTGLSAVGKPLQRGLLLLAEMSSKGNLATGDYTRTTVEMARRHRSDGFVFGFIAQGRVHEQYAPSDATAAKEEDFLILSPGVGLDVKGDKMGQQYRTPREVVLESGCDVIIVGRGIYGKTSEQEVQDEAERYRAEGWKAYQARVQT
ncbi:dihydroorotate dehydrogenase [Naganishia vaughanmartiniae]|uniref:Dihydroorotate dehydrogenase n=1 Tax=Naganishia vaughanmartiniae TaxID=1424756 RepID=A0ACC2XRV0_9TREE|nr:dihydroorotate dehydrogenase [Naganishia vaughanmartiniae]